MPSQAPEALNVLVLEDDVDDAKLVRTALVSLGTPTMVVEQVGRLSEARARLAEGHYDVVLADLSLPDGSGLDVLHALRGAAPGTPVVVLTDGADDAIGVAAVREGAQDRLVKGDTSGSLLAKTLRYAVERHRMRCELERRIEEEAHLRAQLLHADKLNELGRMIAGIAHELTTPIGSVLGFAELLAEDLELDAAARRKFDLLIGEARRARRMLLELTAFSRPGAESRQRICLNDAVRSASALLSSTLRVHRIEFDLDLDPMLVVTEADPDRMCQIVINLVSNAVEAIAAEEQSGRIRIATRSSGPSVQLVIEDDGPGVPEELRLRIFEPFFSTKSERGTGLGLSVVAGIVEDHGGTIRVEPRVDEAQGARFVVTLPQVTATRAVEEEG